MLFIFFLENFLHASNMVWLYSPLTLLKFSQNFASYLLANFTFPSFICICVAAYKMLGFRMTFQTSLLLVIWPPCHPFLCPTLPSPFLLNVPPLFLSPFMYPMFYYVPSQITLNEITQTQKDNTVCSLP